MKTRFPLSALVLLLVLLFSGCEVIGGIFKSGVWVGVILVIAVIGLIIFLVTRGKK